MLLHKSKLLEFLENKGTKHPILLMCQPFKDPSENPQVTESHTSNACLKIQIHVVKIILKIIRFDHFNANLKTNVLSLINTFPSTTHTYIFKICIKI